MRQMGQAGAGVSAEAAEDDGAWLSAAPSAAGGAAAAEDDGAWLQESAAAPSSTSFWVAQEAAGCAAAAEASLSSAEDDILATCAS